MVVTYFYISVTCKNNDCLISFSYDVLFTGGKTEILQKFDKFKSRVVFGAEDTCWPDRNLAKDYPKVSFGYKYLNSGGEEIGTLPGSPVNW